MTHFPSRLQFASLLQYSPRGQTSLSRRLKAITIAIKNDKHIVLPGHSAPLRAIDRLAYRVSKELPKHAFLGRCFADDVTLIPIPRRMPLVKGALWPTLRICEALQKQGLAKEVAPCLERTKPIQRSATAAPGYRPSPEEHFNSVRVTAIDLFAKPLTRITLVDDVITRGSTFVGMYPKIAEAFPGVEINCFAAIRTYSEGDIDQFTAPVSGMIHYNGGNSLHREP